MRPPASDVLKSLGSDSPMALLKKWLEEAKNPSGKPFGKKESLRGKAPRGTDVQEKNPWAAALSTLDSKNQPSSRMILLKKIELKKSEQSGDLIFFTNYKSAKGEDLKRNPKASLLFYWPLMGRQIRVQGTAKKASRKESASYWRTRSRASQLSQLVSRQSFPVSDRESLEELRRRAKIKSRGKAIPRPAHWGGYRVAVQKIEFWLEREHRLHDRFLFEKKVRGWDCRRLFP